MLNAGENQTGSPASPLWCCAEGGFVRANWVADSKSAVGVLVPSFRAWRGQG